MKYLHARKSRQDVEINIVYQTKVSRATLHELVRYGPALVLWLAREKSAKVSVAHVYHY